MKTFRAYILLAIISFWPEFILAQDNNINSSGLPLKSASSVLFGKDIVISDQPSQDQRKVAICSAFNGWIYAAVWNRIDYYHVISILKSEDGGINWNILKDLNTGQSSEIFNAVHLVASGNSTSNLKLFLGLIYYDTVYHTSEGLVARLNGVTGVSEGDILNEQDKQIFDVSIANDYNFPASTTNPGSFAILYSIHGVKDSVIFRSSNDGGMTLNNRKVVAVSTHRFSKVSLNYGRSPSYNSGRYFATWEMKDNIDSEHGHIYTSHTEPDITGSFATPVCLDSLEMSTINQCRNPVIAAQCADFDNDSLNMSEVVLAEKYNPGTNSYSIIGFLNRTAATSNHFTPFNLTGSTNNQKQPAINFNPYDSTFMVTFYDSTLQKLPFLAKGCNLEDPGNWQAQSTGYNDNSTLSNPLPQVALSYLNQGGVNAWISNSTNGHDQALFDWPNSTYTNVSHTIAGDKELGVKIYPNPCTDKCNVQIELKQMEVIDISILTLSGQKIYSMNHQNCLKGTHLFAIAVSTYIPGTYLFSIKTSCSILYGKILIVR